MNVIKKKEIKDTYDFTTDRERLLGKVVVPHKGYRLKEGDLWILGPTHKNYYHPKNVYAYDINTRKFRGRFNLSWFEVLGVFESEEDVIRYLSASQTKNDETFEQLSLFDMLDHQ
jgi:hypothetical protein